jgi:Uma2 family endonuclease
MGTVLPRVLAYGAWTLKSPPNQSGLEPDECYLVGDQDKPTPDLAIEVVWTSGGIDKLEIYGRLGIGEVVDPACLLNTILVCFRL